MVFEIQFESTDTILTYPPNTSLFQASAATVRIGTPAVSMPEATEAATVDSVSTTTTSAADRDADSLEVGSVAGIVAGRKYLVTDAGGRKTVVEVLGASGTTVTIADPLPRDVASGAAFEGIAITHAFTAAETDEKGPGLAKWVATLNGVDIHWDQTFRIVTERFRLPNFAPELQRIKEVRKLRQSTDETLSEMQQAAWEHVVRPRLRGRGFLEERIKTPEELVPTLVEGALYLLYRAAGKPLEDITDQEQRVDRELSRALASSRHWYDEVDEDVVEDRRDHPEFAQNTIRLSR